MPINTEDDIKIVCSKDENGEVQALGLFIYEGGKQYYVPVKDLPRFGEKLRQRANEAEISYCPMCGRKL